MVTERYPLTDEHANCARIRSCSEFFCATYHFLFSTNKKISIQPVGYTQGLKSSIRKLSIRPFGDTQGLIPATSSRELKEVIK